MPKDDNLEPSGWPSPSKKTSSINFVQLFSNPAFNILAFLNLENVIQESKTQGTLVAQQLINNPFLLDRLFSICLRPNAPQNKLLNITNLHPYVALQILTVIDFELLSSYLLSKPQQQEDEDQVVTEQQQNVGDGQLLPIVQHLFAMLQEKKPIEETRLCYMSKIGCLMCYQKPKQMLELFQKNKSISLMLFQHSYSYAILEWFLKLVEIQDSNSFYESEKIAIIRFFIESMEIEEPNTELDLDRLVNYEAFLINLLEKVEERFEKSKFIKMCKIIFNEKYPVGFVVERMNSRISKIQQSKEKFWLDEELSQLMAIIEKYVHFSLRYKPALVTNTHNSINPSLQNRSQSQMGNELDASVVMDIDLDVETFSKIKNQVYFFTQMLWKNNPTFKVTQFACFLRLLKSVILVNERDQTSFIDRVFTPQLISYLISTTTKYATCTIFHNTVKDILIEGLYRNYDSVVRILLDPAKSNFLSIIKQIKGKTNSGDQQYENQFYHIFQVILQKGDDQGNKKILLDLVAKTPSFEELELRVKEKEKLYSTLIGGNPRKLSSCLDESQEVERILASTQFHQNGRKTSEQQASSDRRMIDDQLLSPSANDIIEGNIEHYFQDCGVLPLDSDQSKDDLQNQGKSESLKKDKKNQKFTSVTSELSNRLKNLGAVECEEKEVRFLFQKEKSDKIGSKLCQDASNKSIQEFKDNHEQELEDEIRILEERRQNRRKQYVTDMKKQVNSSDGIHQEEEKLGLANAKMGGPIDLSGILDISSKEKLKSHSQLTEQQNILPSDSNLEMRSGKLEVSEQIEELTKKVQTSPFPTYLSYQINEILAELD